MQHSGVKDTQLRESSNQKVHPQPMDDATNQNPEAMEALVSRIFTNISALKSAYIQLQSAHTPYDPDKIQIADKLVIAELKNLSELKHFYRENNPKPVCVSPQDSRLAAEIQEQQSLLKTYEVMVKKFQSEIQNKDSEILHLEQQIQNANQRRIKLEKNLKLRGLSSKESEGSASESGQSSLELSPELFKLAVESAYRAIHDFSKPLINMMKAAGWDLDAAANSIEPDVIYAKRAHKKYAFESYICQKMFHGFQDKNFSLTPTENQPGTKEGLIQQYLSLREMDPLDAVGQGPDSMFGKFCQSKYLSIVHQKMEASFFGNLDQRRYIMGGGHPRTAFYQAFLKLAKAIWLLHLLAHSFQPSVKIFQVERASEFSEVYMENVVKNFIVEEADQKPKVGLLVMPGFWIGGSVVQSQVYLTGSTLGRLLQQESRKSRARAFIESRCGATLYPDLCVRCLSSYVGNFTTTLSHQKLAQLALKVSLHKAQSTRAYVTSVAKVLEQSKAREYPAVKECLEQINDGVDELTNCIKELQQIKEDEESTNFPWHESNLKTWMSTALTDTSSCMDGFSGRSIRGKTKAIIKAKVLNLQQATSIALAMFNNFAARYRSAHFKKPKV